METQKTKSASGRAKSGEKYQQIENENNKLLFECISCQFHFAKTYLLGMLHCLRILTIRRTFTFRMNDFFFQIQNAAAFFVFVIIHFQSNVRHDKTSFN